jgi:hypothetical protein
MGFLWRAFLNEKRIPSFNETFAKVSFGKISLTLFSFQKKEINLFKKLSRNLTISS